MYMVVRADNDIEFFDATHVGGTPAIVRRSVEADAERDPHTAARFPFVRVAKVRIMEVGDGD
jgi:hypothetical protein